MDGPSPVVVDVLVVVHAAEGEHVEGGTLEADVVAGATHPRQQQLVQQEIGDLEMYGLASWVLAHIQGPALARIGRFCIFFLRSSFHNFSSSLSAQQLSMAHLPVELPRKLLKNLVTELMPALVVILQNRFSMKQ